jgi:5-methyltetrahydropteroyltriglutamate--homocysteine methyltransferase
MSQRIKTAISGSLPKPAWLAEPEKLWAPWQLQGEALEQAKADAMRLAVDDQLRAGITVIGDGEQTRQHFVTTFIEHLGGVDFVNRKTVRIRNRYDADVPVVIDKVVRTKSVFVEDAKRLRKLTKARSNSPCQGR